ncbi:hypothetical protein Q4610_10900 [Sphingobium sp. HBC34]|uniref:DUF6644 domain-containing protein n=1 Tax=Sphingobium cyanobacteriorum TaxID=3063954 RepID=A0ABT8ZLZ6_9SPHN|nr:DUF6644 family protein [Sphingobium sp. HBC34]MDO7835550.1 hypothetical protein [Sphingobium sp. HBC34]
MSLETFGNWLYDTQVSTFLREVSWIIPTVQSIHILAISIVVGSALISDLRLAGVLATDEKPAAIVRRYLPWMWTALVILLLTGIVMLLAEPGRTLNNSIFWTKMALVLVAFALTLFFRKPLLDPEFRLDHARWATMVKPAAWISLLVWVGVIFCGRWIAYT